MVFFCLLCRTQSSSVDDVVNAKGRYTINTSSPSGHSNYILSGKNLEDIEKDKLNPSLMQDTNGHVHNIKQRQTSNINTDRVTFPGMKSNTTTMNEMVMPYVNLRTNISATKITMSSIHTG